MEEKRIRLKRPFRIEDNLHLAPAAMPTLFAALEAYVDWWSETTDDDFDEDTSNRLHQLMQDAMNAMNLAGWTTEYEAVWDGDRYRCGDWNSVDGATWVGTDGAPIKDRRYQEAQIDLKDGPIDGSTWQTHEAKLFPLSN